MMDWTKIQENFPKAFEKWYDHSGFDKTNMPVADIIADSDYTNALYNFRELYDFFDRQRIKISLSYYDKGFAFDITVNERTQCFDEDYKTRTEAETEAFEKAFQILEDKL